MEKSELRKMYSWIEENLLPVGSHLHAIQKIAICRYVTYTGETPDFLTVLPTGKGKSAIFQGPALYDKIVKKSKKIHIVVQPLKALINDQVYKKLKKFNDDNGNLRVASYHGETSEEDKKRIIEGINNDEIALLYITPEQIVVKSFYQLLERLNKKGKLGSITFDEAHCIVSWGNTFRPLYITSFRKCLEIRQHGIFPIHLLSATVPSNTRLELIDEFNISNNTIPTQEGNYCKNCSICNLSAEEKASIDKAYSETLYPIKDNIQLHCEYVKTNTNSRQASLYQKLLRIKEIICDSNFIPFTNLFPSANQEYPESRIIIFTNSRDDAENGCDYLRQELKDCGYENLSERVEYFHAGRSDEKKKELADKYGNGDIVILFATTAFGMGMDIDNIHLVFNLNPPFFIEDFLQEVGRAGRKESLWPVEGVHAVCLYSDDDIPEEIREHGFNDNYLELFDSYPMGIENSGEEDMDEGEEDEEDNEEANSTSSVNQDLAQHRQNTISDDSLTPDVVIDTFERIKKYYNEIVKASSNALKDQFIPIPAGVLKFDSLLSPGNKKDPKPETIERLFLQCLNWLSQKNGFNRIEIGFQCRNSHTVEVNETYFDLSEKAKYLYDYAKNIANNDIAVIIPTDVISYSPAVIQRRNDIEVNVPTNINKDSITSIEDFNDALDECYLKEAFGRYFETFKMSLIEDKGKLGGKYTDFDILIQIYTIASEKSTNDTEQFDKIEESVRKERKIKKNRTAYKKHFTLFEFLSQLYSMDTVKMYCDEIIDYIRIHSNIENEEEYLPWFTWGKVIESIRHEIGIKQNVDNIKKIEFTDDDFRIFLLVLTKLGIIKISKFFDRYHEIKILDPMEISVANNEDAKAIERLNNYNKNRISSTINMKCLALKGMEKELIIKYSEGQRNEE